MLTKSFVTDTPYLQAQARVRDGFLHIQALGAEGNRPYGYSFTTQQELPKAVAEFLDNLDDALVSMAGTGAMYFPVQLKAEDGQVHVQVDGNGETLNREYGAAFDLANCNGFSEWVAEQVASEIEKEAGPQYELGDDILLS